MNISFTPRAYQEEQVPTPKPEVSKEDRIGNTLTRTIQYITVALLFLVPIFFVPKLYASLSFDKSILTAVLLLVGIMFASLSMLRFTKVSTVTPLPLGLFVGVAIAAFLSALLSGDIADAIRGSAFGVQTAGFIALLAVAMAAPLFLQRSKKMILLSLVSFVASASLLLLYSLLRVVFGADFLSLGSFSALTVSPLGGFNDLAILSAVVVVLSLVTLLQLPLQKWMRYVAAGLVVLGLLFLMIVNFFFLWLVIGFFALLFLIYLLTRDTLFSKEDNSTNDSEATPLLLLLTFAVCIVSAFFVIAGDYAGGRISAMTGIDYVEVRPSVSATIDMVKAEYKEDILLGAGPNRFSDVWRVNKDRSINDTAFWNVDFATGFGYVPTLFVTLGLLGGLLIVAFHLSFIYMGYRMLLKSNSTDQFWYYTGTASFTVALMLWVVSYIYSPGAAILILTALFTGLAFVSYGALVPSALRTIPLASSRRQGFFLMGVAVVLVVTSVFMLFGLAKQYIAQATFVEATRNATSIEEFELAVQESYELYQDDRFITALARAKLVNLRQLLAIAEPSEADQNNFVSLAQQTILLGQQAATLDPTNPDPYAILSDTYYALAQAGLDGALEQAYASLEDARWRDPLDPSYSLFEAVMAAQTGDLERARLSASEALNLKRNYGEALYLLAQIDIEEGDVESAIATTQQLVTFEPNNPTRLYQLGILLAADAQFDAAIAAYNRAIELDTNFANARYMLALTLVQQGEREVALEQLRAVQQNNPDNEQLAEIIRQVESGEAIGASLQGVEAPVAETNPNETTEDGVVTTAETDSSLISPVNTPSAEETNETEEPTE